ALTMAPDRLFTRDGAAIVAVLAGPHLLIVFVALLVHRNPVLFLFTPGYLVLRLFRSYVAIEALLSMRHHSLVTSKEQSEREVEVPEREEERVPVVASQSLAGSNGRRYRRLLYRRLL